ncbi:RIP metalloprotease RseP [Sediminimonas qiaohouensis]|uniref:RIP metalloprotease RseP n=1 Tax=Sediminimonas qiaohouensis TaxID=552061 RepID=UPI0004199BEE|nr:RIP metalloprotease RseP [Sediminimonas qiaohouensis]
MDPITFIPEIGGLIWTIVAFVIALSVIVAVHEYGHYIIARWSGIRSEVFSLGFGPVLWSRMDKHGTRWQVALLPFGGYVKFLGDSDAASGKDGEVVASLSEEEQRHTMHGAPLWARTATVAAGPVFNFVLAVAIFTAIGLTRGVPVEPLTVGSVHPMPVAHDIRPGDTLLTVEGHAISDISGEAGQEVIEDLPKQALLDYTVRRDGRETRVQGPFIMPPMVQQLSPQSAAYNAGLKAGDVITAVDGAPIVAFDQLKDRVLAAEGAALLLDVWRDGETLQLTLAPRRVDEPTGSGGFETNWRIGILGGMFFDPATESPGPVEALIGGVATLWEIIVGSVSGLYHMITGAISSCNMSGPIGIAEVSGQMASQGAISFIYFVGVLSAAVGLLNLFPIPVLDGGHLVFYAYEAVVGKPPSDQALRVLMAVGLALILSVMLFALSNDVLCP